MSLTLEELRAALPKQVQGAASPEFLAQLNGLEHDYETVEVIKDNFVTYTKVLTEGKYKLGDYLNAVQYVTFKVMGYSNKDAYAKTFPQRYQVLVMKGTSDKDISAYVAAYNKNQLVNKILGQTAIAPSILFVDTFHKAIAVQADLMMNATSEKVRTEAANSLLTHLKPPEIKKVELAVDVKQDAGIADLKASLVALAQQQVKAIEGGQSAREVSRIPVIQAQPVPEPVDAEFVEVKADVAIEARIPKPSLFGSTP